MRPDQPRVRDNDWSVLDVPALGAWAPSLEVSVIIPAHDPAYLPLVLAGLAAQSYPAHLLEVVVVDDGSQPPLSLPEVRPERTRLVSTLDGWGRAAACHTGVQVSEGSVLHWLDADMVPRREEVEAHLRWHHAIDYAVVLGRRLFAEANAFDHLSPTALRDALAGGDRPEDLARGFVDPKVWTDPILAETRNLCDAGPRAMRLHIGASGSVGRDLYDASGGMPRELLLGEDIVLGYRLREAGAVFIPDPDACSVHPGPSGVMDREERTNRYNKPFITDLVPEFRGHRLAIPRSYTVPYVEVVLPVGADSYEAVAGAVNALLNGNVPDLVVSLVADWSSLTDERRSVLGDPHLDLRLLQGAFGSEPRIRFLDSTPEVSPATFRLSLPGPAFHPVGKALGRQLHAMETQHWGVQIIEIVDGATARIERTASVARAHRVAGSDTISDVLTEVCAIETGTAEVAGFVTAGDSPRIRQLRGLVPWGVQQ